MANLAVLRARELFEVVEEARILLIICIIIFPTGKIFMIDIVVSRAQWIRVGHNSLPEKRTSHQAKKKGGIRPP